LKYIHEKDTVDALGAAARQWQQLKYEFVVDQNRVSADNIILASVGNSALAARLSQLWPVSGLPTQVVEDYDIPAYASERTCFIAISYSGNSAETISATLQAIERGAQVMVVSGGGQLTAIAHERHLPLVVIPSASQAYFTTLFSLKAVLTMFEQGGLLADKTATDQLSQAAAFMEAALTSWLPTVPVSGNRAKQIALDSIGKSVVMYSGSKLAPVAWRWKNGFNELAKQVAWANSYPNLTHGELVGWSDQPIDKPYGIIELRSNQEHPQIQKQFMITERLLSGLWPAPIIVDALGDTLVEQLFWMFGLGDFTAAYTALANGNSPVPAPIVETFKKHLEE
jgi:glucose/mannose-6-phosphate isomerase